MYQLIEAQQDYYLGVTEQWKVKWTLLMPICMHEMHDYLPFAVSWQERDAASQALIANLRQQIETLQEMDNNDHAKEEREDDTDDDEE